MTRWFPSWEEAAMEELEAEERRASIGWDDDDPSDGAEEREATAVDARCAVSVCAECGEPDCSCLPSLPPHLVWIEPVSCPRCGCSFADGRIHPHACGGSDA